MSAHPSRNRLQFLNCGVALQIVAAPTDEGHVARHIAETRDHSVDGRRSVVLLPVALVAVIDGFIAARAIRRSENPVHDIRLGEERGIEGQIPLFRSIPHAHAQNGGAVAQRGEALAFVVSSLLPFPRGWGFGREVAFVSRRATLGRATPCVVIGGQTGTTSRGNAALGVFCGLEKLQRSRAILLAFATRHRPVCVERLHNTHRSPPKYSHAIADIYDFLGRIVTGVWGNEVESSIDLAGGVS